MAKFKLDSIVSALDNPECAALKQEYEKFREMYYQAVEEIDRLRGELGVIASAAGSPHGEKDTILNGIRERAQAAARHRYEI